MSFILFFKILLFIHLFSGQKSHPFKNNTSSWDYKFLFCCYTPAACPFVSPCYPQLFCVRQLTPFAGSSVKKMPNTSRCQQAQSWLNIHLCESGTRFIPPVVHVGARVRILNACPPVCCVNPRAPEYAHPRQPCQSLTLFTPLCKGLFSATYHLTPLCWCNIHEEGKQPSPLLFLECRC